MPFAAVRDSGRSGGSVVRQEKASAGE